MGRKGKLKAARRKNLVDRQFQFPYGGNNCNIKCVRRFTLEDLEFKNWEASLVEDIFDGTTDIWIDFSNSTPGIPLYFINSGRFDEKLTAPRQEAWNAVAANPEFQQDIVGDRDKNTLWFGITHKNSNTGFYEYTLDEAYENFMACVPKNDLLGREIAHLLAASFFIRKTHKGSRSLFFLIDSEEKDEVTKPSGGSIFFMR
ncbi:hypothetical protein [Calothrix sp. CCY 0018]|uniref:hypothetical protein n=1 Tax=Calothrix sp. CCY 0018 TaxID=3103864 RepID=UPI0039C63E68